MMNLSFSSRSWNKYILQIYAKICYINWNQVVLTIFRLNLNQTELRLLQNQSEYDEYNLISVDLTRIRSLFLCI